MTFLQKLAPTQRAIFDDCLGDIYDESLSFMCEMEQLRTGRLYWRPLCHRIWAMLSHVSFHAHTLQELSGLQSGTYELPQIPDWLQQKVAQYESDETMRTSFMVVFQIMVAYQVVLQRLLHTDLQEEDIARVLQLAAYSGEMIDQSMNGLLGPE